jgi:mRNA-degrading endonuclease toxin of MazEF toxin-antitoxin module
MMTHLDRIQPTFDNPLPGEIRVCDFGYHMKNRPAVVISPSRQSAPYGTLLVMPITSQDRDDQGPRFSLVQGEAGLKKQSWIKLDQACEVGFGCIGPKIGRLQQKRLGELIQAAGVLIQSQESGREDTSAAGTKYLAKTETLRRLGWLP